MSYIEIDNKKFEINIIENVDSQFPRKLLQINRCPKKIYVIGNQQLLNNFSIAIVGSRNCTEYGINETKKIASKLSEYGITIVSGLAKGIDTIAHKYSMNNKGKTIAVLATGFNKIYPKENQKLFNEILLNNGCAVTEYDVDTEANSNNFPIRNRIISGLSTGVLLIEAMKKSGSNITARYALKQDKKLFCIPNSVNVKQAEGTNMFIRNGAILTRNYKDIIEEYMQNYYYEKSKNEKIKIPNEYKQVYENLTQNPININELYRKVNLESISKLNQILYMMELDGYVEQLIGNNYIKK